MVAQIESSELAMELVHRIQEDNDFLTQLAGAWSDGDEAVRRGPPLQGIEGYRILSEIHRGGQGVGDDIQDWCGDSSQEDVHSCDHSSR